MRTDIDTIYIGGEWITPLSTSRIEIRSSAPAARAACWLVGSQPIRRYEREKGADLARAKRSGE
jgi:hypothetical protein